MGMKASDACVAFLCHDCHSEVDQGRQDRSWKRETWFDAYRATMRWLIESGHFIVSPVPTPPPVIPAKPKAKIAKGRPLQSRPFAKPAVPVRIPARGFGPSKKARAKEAAE